MYSMHKSAGQAMKTFTTDEETELTQKPTPVQKHTIETTYTGVHLKWLGGLSSYCKLNFSILMLIRGGFEDFKHYIQ